MKFYQYLIIFTTLKNAENCVSFFHLLGSINYRIVFSTSQFCYINHILKNFIAKMWFSRWQTLDSSYTVNSVDILLKKWSYVLWLWRTIGGDTNRVLFHQTSGLSSTHPGVCKMNIFKAWWNKNKKKLCFFFLFLGSN